VFMKSILFNELRKSRIEIVSNLGKVLNSK
jgi:hypothetical protein